jgi:hypothetical protein
MRVIAASLACLLAPAVIAESALPAPAAAATALSVGAQATDVRIDYTAFDEILGAIVYRVGPSDRQPAYGVYQQTGTRISRANDSRYRYEGNRILFHLLNEGHRAALSEYRQELEAIPSRVDMEQLSSDEQLAFWLNLHNAVMLDTLAEIYPVRNVATARIDGERLLQAPLVNLPSGPVSLEYLRKDIVAAEWSDPRVMYGFFTGMIGGPSIQREAFSGATVWSQLDRIGSEFVNSLRGVELFDSPVQISPLYFEYESLFPEGDSDIRRHLLRYADSEVRGLVSNADRFRALSTDTAIADITNGSNCADGIVGQLETTTGGSRTFNGGCSVLPPIAVNFVEFVEDRRFRLFQEGRLGNVTVIDIPTEDNSSGSDETTPSQETPEPDSR